MRLDGKLGTTENTARHSSEPSLGDHHAKQMDGFIDAQNALIFVSFGDLRGLHISIYDQSFGVESGS
jgi:hypothetical protein